VKTLQPTHRYNISVKFFLVKKSLTENVEVQWASGESFYSFTFVFAQEEGGDWPCTERYFGNKAEILHFMKADDIFLFKCKKAIFHIKIEIID